MEFEIRNLKKKVKNKNLNKLWCYKKIFKWLLFVSVIIGEMSIVM